MKPDTLVKVGIFLAGLAIGAVGTYLTFDERVDRVEQRVIIVEMRLTGSGTTMVSVGPALTEGKDHD